MKKRRPNFAGLRVMAFENRRSSETLHLIEQYGGVPTLVPCMVEIPLETNPDLRNFERALLANEIAVTLFLTGVGVRLLAGELDRGNARALWTHALKKTTVVVRSPKPAAALRELHIPIAIRAPHPHTWREVIVALDQANLPLKGNRIAIQEYGMMNRNLLKALTQRGAQPLRVPLYKWSLPADLGPLRRAIETIADGDCEVALFSTGTQVWHLFRVATKIGLESELRDGLRRMVVGSIGPATSEALADFDLKPDFTPSQTKIGPFIADAAQLSSDLYRLK